LGRTHLHRQDQAVPAEAAISEAMSRRWLRVQHIRAPATYRPRARIQDSMVHEALRRSLSRREVEAEWQQIKGRPAGTDPAVVADIAAL